MTAGALASLAGGAAAQEPSSPAGVITNPDWARAPSSAELSSVWPIEAAKRGRGGRAVIECEVSSEGGLRECHVLSETPTGLGFGGAALTLAAQFRMKPRTVDGVPVTGGLVRIPIGWKGSPGGSGGAVGRVSVISRPVWAATPTRAEMEAVYPAAGGGVRGSATLACRVKANGTLRTCEKITEAPRGRGFGHAAKLLSDRFRLGVLTLADGRSVEGADVRIPFQFDPPGSGPGDMGGAQVTAADWRTLPNAERMTALYPEAAKAKGVNEGRAVLGCTIGVGGALRDCRVEQENPAGLGFGAAALALSGSFALSPWTAEGKPTDGAAVRIPIRYVLPEEAEAAPAAPSAP
jgi:TonB family protein